MYGALTALKFYGQFSKLYIFLWELSPVIEFCDFYTFSVNFTQKEKFTTFKCKISGM